MSKYTEDQLREMAQTVIGAQSMGDDRYLVLIMRLVVLTGMSPSQVHAEIDRLATA